MFLRQSTASQEILLGRFVDSADGDSEEVGLTIANTDIKIFKHGATTLASKNSGGGTHIANGNYSVVLDATDTDTLGNMEVHVHVAGALAIKREYTVLPAMVYDSLVLGTDFLDVGSVAGDVAGAVALIGSGGITFTSFDNGAITSSTFAAGAIDSASIGLNAITAAKLAADVATELQVGGGGSTTITITPMVAAVTNPRFTTRDLGVILKGSAPADYWIITDGAGAAVDLTDKLIRFVVYSVTDEGVLTDTTDDTTLAAFKYESSSGGGITVDGADSNRVTVQFDEADTATPGKYRYVLWNVTDLLPLARGRLTIDPAEIDA